MYIYTRDVATACYNFNVLVLNSRLSPYPQFFLNLNNVAAGLGQVRPCCLNGVD